MAGANPVLDAIRAAGLTTEVVGHQSGIACGLIIPAQVAAVKRRVEEILGPLDVWEVRPQGDGDDRNCRKPAPGMVLRA